MKNQKEEFINGNFKNGWKKKVLKKDKFKTTILIL